MDPVDDLVYSKRLRKPKGELTLFEKSVNFIRLPNPPQNSSLEAGKELLVIQGATYLRGEGMVKGIKKHDKDPAFAIKLYLSIFGLPFEQEEIDKLISESAIVIRSLKNRFNRPRPTQLAPYFGIQFEPLKSTTAKSPSYPSGHSAQARLLAEFYGSRYPEHLGNLIKASEECGEGRVMAGLHFPSDHKAGVYLAKRLFKLLKTTKKIKYNQRFDFTTKKGGF